MKMIKTFLSNILNGLGYEIRHKERRKEQEKLAKWTWMQNIGIQTILDIGANKGQFSDFILKVFPKASIHSFEPIKECFDLMNLALAKFPNFHSYNVGLSDKNGEEVFFENNFTESSSILSMESLHVDLFPHTSSIKKRTIKMVTLDSFKDKIKIDNNLLIKIDVQGAENKVIKGGKLFFDQASIILIEVNYFSFYQGQPLFQDIFNILSPKNFVYLGNLEQFNRSKDGFPLFADAIFVNSKLATDYLTGSNKVNYSN